MYLYMIDILVWFGFMAYQPLLVIEKEKKRKCS